MNMMRADCGAGISRTTDIPYRSGHIPEMSLHIVPGAHILRFLLNPAEPAAWSALVEDALQSGTIQRIQLLNPDGYGIAPLQPDTLLFERVIHFTAAEQYLPGNRKISGDDAGLKSALATVNNG